MSLTLVEAIVHGYKSKASKILEKRMVGILREKLIEAKKIVATKYGLQEYVELNELSPELVGKVNKEREIGGKPSKTSTAAKTLQRAVKKAFLKDRGPKEEQIDEEFIDEANVQRSGRLKIIKARVRGGKVQRRKKLSAVKGYTLRGGKLVRMSPTERRKRKLGARKAKIKRRRTLNRALMKRRRSLIKRKALGL